MDKTYTKHKKYLIIKDALRTYETINLVDFYGCKKEIDSKADYLSIYDSYVTEAYFDVMKSMELAYNNHKEAVRLRENLNEALQETYEFIGPQNTLQAQCELEMRGNELFEQIIANKRYTDVLAKLAKIVIVQKRFPIDFFNCYTKEEVKLRTKELFELAEKGIITRDRAIYFDILQIAYSDKNKGRVKTK